MELANHTLFDKSRLAAKGRGIKVGEGLLVESYNMIDLFNILKEGGLQFTIGRKRPWFDLRRNTNLVIVPKWNLMTAEEKEDIEMDYFTMSRTHGLFIYDAHTDRILFRDCSSNGSKISRGIKNYRGLIHLGRDTIKTEKILRNGDRLFLGDYGPLEYIKTGRRR